MLRLSTGVVRLSGRQLATSFAQVSSSSQPAEGTDGSKTYTRKHIRNNGNRKSNDGLTVEHQVLQTKFRKQLDDTLHISTMSQLVDHVEWRGLGLSGKIVNMTAKLFADPNQKLDDLSDRQISVALSVFGNACDTVSRTSRIRLLNQSLLALTNKGIKLGTLSRNAILAARLDNGESVQVVSELSQMESEGLIPDAQTYELLARAYALQGKPQAVVGIVNHMTASGMAVEEGAIIWVVYSLVRDGQYTQAEAMLKKLGGRMNETRLRCSAASAAVARGETDQALRMLSAIPITAKLHTTENNRHVLMLLCEMVELGVDDAFEKLSPYLIVDPDNSSHLAEFHNNGGLMARVRRARSEGLLNEALTLYSVMHPNFKSSSTDGIFLDQFHHYLKNSDCDIDKMFSLAAKLTNTLTHVGNVWNAYTSLLDAAINSSHTAKVWDRLRTEGKAFEALAGLQHGRRELAKKLSHVLTDSDASQSVRSKALADVATVLFWKESRQAAEARGAMTNWTEDPVHFFPIIHSLALNDVDLICGALGHCDDIRVRRDLATAIVYQLERSDDPLACDKTERLLNSGAVKDLGLVRLVPAVIRIVSNKAKLEASEYSKNLQRAAKMVALGFPPEGSFAQAQHTSKPLTQVLSSESISNEQAEKFVALLENENRVSIPNEDMKEAQKTLTEKKFNEKAELLTRLKRKSQTYSRWKQSSIEELKEEMEYIRQDPNHKVGAVEAIQEIVLNKHLQQKPLDVTGLICDIESLDKSYEVSESGHKPSSRIVLVRHRTLEDAIEESIRNNNLAAVDKLAGLSNRALTVHLALCRSSLHLLSGAQEKAVEVSEDLRASAQTIDYVAINKMSALLSWLSVTEMETVCNFLQERFALSANLTKLLMSGAKTRQLKQMIEKGELRDAMSMAKYETRKAGRAFGQLYLFCEGIKQEKSWLVEETLLMVQNTHGKTDAMLDLSMALLEVGGERNTQWAIKTLQGPNMTIREKKMEFLINRAANAGRVDVLHGLWSGFSHQADKVSNVALNQLLLKLCRMYYKNGDMEKLNTLKAEVEELSFPLEQSIRKSFENLSNKRPNKVKYNKVR